jgi:hypothetical protein
MKLSSSFILVCLLSTSVVASAQSIHYLDCDGGNDAHDSLSSESAWKTVAQANRYAFQPGDPFGHRRPEHTGSPGKEITLGAYGVGDLPQIVGTGNEAGLKLYDQQYWKMEHLNITGGNPFGIVISGTLPTLSFFRISDVVVHDVTGEPKSKDSGLIVIAPGPTHLNCYMSGGR